MEELLDLAIRLISEGDPVNGVLGLGLGYLIFKTRTKKQTKMVKAAVREAEEVHEFPAAVFRALLEDKINDDRKRLMALQESMEQTATMVHMALHDAAQSPSSKRLMEMLDELEEPA